MHYTSRARKLGLHHRQKHRPDYVTKPYAVTQVLYSFGLQSPNDCVDSRAAIMLHLTCGTNFLLLFVFLVSSILHQHTALLYPHAVILDRLLAFFVAFSIPLLF